MGYTNYWYRPKSIPAKVWEAFRADACLLINTWNRQDDPKRRVAWEYNAAGKLPDVNGKVVRFNGTGELGHETFLIERTIAKDEQDRAKPDGTYFAFCKTSRKPYDDLVVAVLVALKHHCPAVKVSSDGSDKDWRERGIPFCQTVLGYGQEYAMGENGLELSMTATAVV